MEKTEKPANESGPDFRAGYYSPPVQPTTFLSNTFFAWAMDNIFKPNQLATVLLVVFLLMFMGILPSPMLSSISSSAREHSGMVSVLRQICVNTAKSQDAINLCFYEKEPPR